MPIYEYLCKDCGADSELIVPRQKCDSVRCPQCGSAKMERKLSVFSSKVDGGTLPCGRSASERNSCSHGSGHHHSGGCCGGCCCGL